MRIGLAVLLAGCTLSQMEQMSKPKEATEPKSVSFPEGESMVNHAASDFAHKSNGTVLATYLTSRWNPSHKGGHEERSAGLYVFWQRKGGAVVKNEAGESGAVCFQSDCSLVQRRSGGRWGSAFVECDDHSIKKVTCSSVHRFGSRHHSR